MEQEYIGKHAKKRRNRSPYQSNRYIPGFWNGLNGGTHRAQYFRSGSANRMCAMFEIANILHEYGVRFTITIFKDYYRVMVKDKELCSIPREAKDKIMEINVRYYTKDW